MTNTSGDAHPLADAMTTSVSVHDEATVLTVAGEVDLATAPALENAIEATLGSKPPVVIIDLTQVSFLASAGMAALVGAHKRAGETTRIMVVADGPATGRQLKVTGLDKVFAMHTTLDGALTALHQN
ncbi:STAS domain-containing protein [Nocardia macrotermitis]|uniref:Anti-sigma factor antagonist n=1 Tax=Nocardia macrotermitis TaxID=2585198 RepID=A0A7K0CV47_9NOCA|nr:STAS domain-containing protein [Nocardia macrotermitis]MQY17311.1 Anti-sigma-F factor antagonist RsfB [Nocardia macrotermitis]